MPKIPPRWLPWRRRVQSARVWNEARHTPSDIEIMRAIVTRTPREEYDAAIARLLNQQGLAHDDLTAFRLRSQRRHP